MKNDNHLRSMARGRLSAGSEHQSSSRKLGEVLDSMDDHALYHGIPAKLRISLVCETGKCEIDIETMMTHLPLWEALNHVRQALMIKGENLLKLGEDLLLEAQKLEGK